MYIITRAKGRKLFSLCWFVRVFVCLWARYSKSCGPMVDET